ncbi:MAG: DUF763 domain-containing protein [Chloroflexi bacterium]|nr:DUF763 domain-containing protein [Chloroflexota bacterium]MBM3174577.1 DUF763 domain-containing protein [Chloroflexota bacterium]MBM4451173.1 DUF763 domain-containing protein [Chloroflexota bacterium]
MTNTAQRTGIANLPLHYGKAPRWLFDRMTKLAREITIAITAEFGPQEMLQRLSDPYWFQAFGCVLGYDWHSSGVTTTVCGALKEGVKGLENDLGLFVAGGKGKTSRKTPSEIESFGDKLNADPSKLVYASRMSAKVDSSAVQDGYQLYHHVFVFTKDGAWSVVQQGMNESNRYARRYHWLGEKVNDFVCEPHSAICAEAAAKTLNLVAVESTPARDIITQVANQQKPEKLLSELKWLKALSLPARHSLLLEDIHPDRLSKTLLITYERQPENFETLLGLEGVGAKTLRALSLISELVYDVPVSLRDPARYSFAHGGKDGIPYPVDRKSYDKSIEVLHQALERAKVGDTEKIAAFKRLKAWL